MQFKQNQHRISTNQFKTNQKWELRRWSWDFTTSFCFSSGIIFEKVIFKQYLSSCPLFFSWFPPRFSIGTFLDSIVCVFFCFFFKYNLVQVCISPLFFFQIIIMLIEELSHDTFKQLCTSLNDGLGTGYIALMMKGFPDLYSHVDVTEIKRFRNPAEKLLCDLSNGQITVERLLRGVQRIGNRKATKIIMEGRVFFYASFKQSTKLFLPFANN